MTMKEAAAELAVKVIGFILLTTLVLQALSGFTMIQTVWSDLVVGNPTQAVHDHAS